MSVWLPFGFLPLAYPIGVSLVMLSMNHGPHGQSHRRDYRRQADDCMAGMEKEIAELQAATASLKGVQKPATKPRRDPLPCSLRTATDTDRFLSLSDHFIPIAFQGGINATLA